MIDYTDALAAGWRVFPLHAIENGKCGCGNPKCEAIGKHPRQAGWQHTPQWSPEQLAYLEDESGLFFGNQLQDGYGIVVDTSGLIVVDVDGRNGGFDSAEKLAEIRAQCGYIVRTGSGAGEHWYFRAPAGVSLRTHHKEFKGIDFKSSGYVVGAYSLHKSGMRYEEVLGTPANVTDAPQALIDLLARSARGDYAPLQAQDMGELAEMVSAIPNDGVDYDRWIEIGMGIHYATEGSTGGLNLWHEWSLRGNPAESLETCEHKWHSFGKYMGDHITGATIRAAAEESGWTQSVTFEDDTDWGDWQPKEATPAPQDSTTEITQSGVDLLNPPGICGHIVKWINSRTINHRRHLAVAAGLQILSNAAIGVRATAMHTPLNLISMAIAGSRTGKGAVEKCVSEAMRELGLAAATHGKFKSSQELVRNAIMHQPVLYVYDEFGSQLAKLAGAEKGGAHYLVDLIPELIGMYSKCDDVHGLSGDMKREMRELAQRKYAALCKKANLPDDAGPTKDPVLAKAHAAIAAAENGIASPYVTLLGFSEPNSFHAALNADKKLIQGGFMGRALIFEELETVPEPKPIDEISRDPLPEWIYGELRMVLGVDPTKERLAYDDEIKRIGLTDDAAAKLDGVRKYWREVARAERDAGTGLESLALGAEELAIKVAGLLCVNKSEIDGGSMAWAHELVKKVTRYKIGKAKADESLTSTDRDERGDGLLLSILTVLEGLAGEEITAGRLRQRITGGRKMAAKSVQAALDHLVSKGKVCATSRNGENGKNYCYYRLT